MIEKYIRMRPDHWFWFHRRWKTLQAWPWPNPEHSPHYRGPQAGGN
jgi:lauroyl/myristoyl acyltransferase